MDHERAIILEFQPQIDAELARIGCDDDRAGIDSRPGAVPAIGIDRPFTREAMADFIATLRAVPVGSAGVGCSHTSMSIRKVYGTLMHHPPPNVELKLSALASVAASSLRSLAALVMVRRSLTHTR